MSISASLLPFADALSILGLNRGASRGEIDAAWKRRVFETHPDRNKGDSEDFIRINEAYSTLKNSPYSDRETPKNPAAPNESRTTRTEAPRKPAPQPGRPSPRRHRILERNDVVSDTVLALCRAKLEEVDGGTHHVPHMIRRQGRRVTYLIKTLLEKGTNHVALPTGQLVDHRKVTAVLLPYQAFNKGSHILEVTEPTLGELFPGATQITIEFGAEI